MWQYVFGKCEELETKGIKVENPSRVVGGKTEHYFVVHYKVPRKFTTRIAALKAAEKLAEAVERL